MFFESDYRALEAKRRDFFEHSVNGHIALHRDHQRYRLTYTYRLYPSTLPPDTKRPALSPLSHTESTSGGYRVMHACVPDELRTCFAPQAGFFYGYPIQTGGRGRLRTPVDFSYTCELTVQGRMGPTASAPLSACEYRRYSEVDPKLAQEAAVKNFFAELGLRRSRRPVGKGTLHLRPIGRRPSASKKPRSHRRILASSIHVVLNDNGGHCITLVQCVYRPLPLTGYRGASRSPVP